jgi:lambda repressor-like predicted transcriptional regulator
MITAAKTVKMLGGKSLEQVSRQTGVSRRTLDNWHKNRYKLFVLVVKGCNVE